MLDNTTELLLRPNAPGLAPEALDLLYEGLLPWLDAGGDEQMGFCYSTWLGRRPIIDGSCGTTACIGGWLMVRTLGLREARARESQMSGGELVRLVSEALGTDWNTADDLCVGGSRLGLPRPTAAQAAAVVRHWLETGEVRWDLVMSEEDEL